MLITKNNSQTRPRFPPLQRSSTSEGVRQKHNMLSIKEHMRFLVVCVTADPKMLYYNNTNCSKMLLKRTWCRWHKVVYQDDIHSSACQQTARRWCQSSKDYHLTQHTQHKFCCCSPSATKLKLPCFILISLEPSYSLHDVSSLLSLQDGPKSKPQTNPHDNDVAVSRRWTE